jgi:hypothetical protein
VLAYTLPPKNSQTPKPLPLEALKPDHEGSVRKLKASPPCKPSYASPTPYDRKKNEPLSPHLVTHTQNRHCSQNRHHLRYLQILRDSRVLLVFGKVTVLGIGLLLTSMGNLKF